MKLSDLPIDRPIGTLVVLVSLMVLGTVAISRLSLDFFPSVDTPYINLEIPFPGSHPLEGLREVIQPLEAEIAAIPGLKNLSSGAEPNSVSVRAEFDWDANLDLRKMEVREAVERLRPTLPEGVGRIQVTSWGGGPGGGAVLYGRLSAERSLSESWELLDRRIRRPLERIKGVARVELGGVEPQQVLVELDPVALRQYGLEPREVLQRIDAANLDLDLGAIRGDLLRYNVRSLGRFETLQDVANLVLGQSGVRLRDVATVVKREKELDYGRHLNGEFAISLEVQKEPTANTVEVSRKVLERIEGIKKDPELKGINLLIWNDAGAQITNSLQGLLEAGLYGGLLAITLLFLFLRRVRTTVIVAMAIPFSLVVTCGGMYLFGKNFNVLTMLGLMLGVGMLVDNAVVVIENIYRLQASGMAPREAARVGVRQVFMAVLASTATSVVVWSWLFVAERGPLTIYMGEVAITICLAVICSLIISVTFIPLAASRFLPKEEIQPGAIMGWIIPAYRRLLAWTLRHRLASLVVLVALAGSAYYPISEVEKSAEPKMRTKNATIVIRAQNASTKEVTEAYVTQIEAWLTSHKEVLGYGNLYSFYKENGFALVMVYLPEEVANPKSIEALRSRLREGLPEIPGAKIEVGDRAWWRQRQGRQVLVALHGEDPEYLQELAVETERLLKDLPDVKEIRGPSLRGQSEARVMVDPDKARRLGSSPRAIADTVAFSYRGRSVRRFQAAQGELEMQVTLPEDFQMGLGVLEDLPIPRSGAESVPLGSMARVEVLRTELEVAREDRQVTSRVGVGFEDAITTEEGKARITQAMRALRLPEGYSWDFGQWGRQREDGMNTMLMGVLLSLLVVMLLLAALFESLVQPLAILITLPMAFFGGFWSLWLLDLDLDSVAFMGVIILIGIVVNNGIVLVDHVNGLRRGGMARVEALLVGCGDRLRPVLMTAITTLAGLMPLALSSYTVANAYVNSLAIVVIGGLATSTLFTLLALPVWYTTLEDLAVVFVRALPQPLKPTKIARSFNQETASP